MKYLLSFLLFGLSLITLAAQNGDHMKMMSDFTPEQQAILKTKKMAVQLDLSSSQQDQILAINKKMAADHKKRMKSHKAIMENDKKPTSDERFKMMNEMYDRQIAHQNQMKKILNDDQYASWRKSKMDKMSKMHKKGMKDKMGKDKMGKGGMHKKDASSSSKHKEMMKEKNKS